MEPKDVVGKIARYRSIDHRLPIEVRAISSRTLSNLAGRTITLFKMENGDEVDATDCYFELSSDSAS